MYYLHSTYNYIQIYSILVLQNAQLQIFICVCLYFACHISQPYSLITKLILPSISHSTKDYVLYKYTHHMHPVYSRHLYITLYTLYVQLNAFRISHPNAKFTHRFYIHKQ